MINKIYIKFLLFLIILVYTFFISLYFGSYYTAGDQIFYSMLYEELRLLEFFPAYTFYSLMLNPVEFVYFLYSWIGASLNIDKLLWFSFSNVFLSIIFVLFLKNLKINFLMILLLFFSNFYIYVLFLAAERLKFGFLLFFLSFLVTSNRKLFFYGILAVFSHIQMLIFYLSLIFLNIPKKYKSKMFYKKFMIYIPFLVILISPFITVVSGHIFSKLELYIANGGITSILKQLLFMLFSMYCYKRRSLVFFSFLPLIAVSFIIGDERVTLFSYFLFIYFSSFRNNGINVPTFLLIFYFGFKSIIFIYRVFETGSGFISNS